MKRGDTKRGGKAVNETLSEPGRSSQGFKGAFCSLRPILEIFRDPLYVIDECSRIVYVNHAFEQLHQIPSGTVLTTRFDRVGSIMEIQVQKDRDDHVFRTGVTTTHGGERIPSVADSPVEVSPTLADHEWNAVRSLCIEPDGTKHLVVVLNRGDDSQKNANDAEVAEQRYRTLFESSSDAVMLLTEVGFIDCNPAALRMFGITSKDVFCSLSPGQLSPARQPNGEESLQAGKTQIGLAFARGENRFEWVHRRSGGELFDAEVSLKAFELNQRKVLQAVVRDITAHKRVEKQVRQSEQKFRLLWEKSADGMRLTDDKGTILMVNETFCQMTKRERAELVDHPLTVAYWEPERERAVRRYQDRFKTGKVETHFQREMTLTDGSRLYLDVTNSFLEIDGEQRLLLSIFRDITKQKRYEAKLRASEERYRLISENVADYIYLFNPKGECLYASPSFSNMGYEPDSLVDRNLFDFVHPDDLIRLKREIKDIENTFHHRSMEFRFTRSDDEWSDMEASLSLLFNDDGYRIVMVMRDVTERKRSEHLRDDLLTQVQQKNLEVEEALRRLTLMQESILQSEKMASLGQLTAGIAHEINNPLAFVSSNLNRFEEYFTDVRSLLSKWTDLAERYGLEANRGEESAKLREETAYVDLEFVDQDFATLMKNTREGTARIKKIVEQLRGFAHISVTDFTATDMNRLIEDTLSLVWNELKYKATVIRKYGALPPVQCSSGEMQQVFVNLLVNAAHAIVDKGEITVQTTASASEVCIAIADTGGGISKENLKRIFDPFFTTKPVGKGTGLGLWIVSTILQKHNGAINVESEPGKGAKFIIHLPTGREQSQGEGSQNRGL